MSITKLSQKSKSESYERELKQISLSVEPAEVFDIILDSSHEEYEGPGSVGTIKFKRLFTDKQKGGLDYYKARPLNAGIKQYPLKHEIVLIVLAPDIVTSVIDQSVSFYYTDVVNVWGKINNNALPYSTFQKTYIDDKDSDSKPSNFTGNMSNDRNEISLGEHFTEQIKRPGLIPYEGDTIIEGRFGSSIHFSSTYVKTKNPWSLRGTESDPIVIIRVDKKDSNEEFVNEDVNEDASSIYICDGQLIPLEPAYSNWKSFRLSPTAPADYKEKQVVINSGRLFFNAKEENIFLSAKKSISIAAKETVNIDFGDKFVSGNQSTAQKITRGEDLITLLNSLVFPSPMGPIPFNSAPQWIAKQNGKDTLSSKNYME